MEHAIRTRIILEVVECEDAGHPCKGCYFENECRPYERTDCENIIYKEIKEK